MFDFLKRLIIFAIGLWVILYLAQIVLGSFSLTGAAKDLTGALREISSLGQRNSSSTKPVMGYYTDGSSGVTKAATLKTTTGADSAVNFMNFSSGNMVSTSTAILGNIKDTWLYEGQTVVRFTDENGTVLATSQLVANTNQTFGGMSPFSILPTVTKTNGTGYMIIEKANPSGLQKNSAQYVIAVTYPISTSSRGTSASGGYGTTFSSSTNTKGTVYGVPFSEAQ